MKKQTVYSIVIMGFCYELMAQVVNKPIILPKMNEIIMELGNVLFSQNFIEIIITTIGRTLIAYLIVLCLSLAFGGLCGLNQKLKQFMQPIVSFIRVVPTISVIIIFMIWFGRDLSPFFIVGFVVFPIMYELIVAALESVQGELYDVSLLFGCTRYERFKAVYYPPLFKAVSTGLFATIGLAFKSCVMAEVLVQSSVGIGQMLQTEKTYLNMAGVFAWTLILMVIVYGFEFVLKIAICKLSSTISET